MQFVGEAPAVMCALPPNVPSEAQELAVPIAEPDREKTVIRMP